VSDQPPAHAAAPAGAGRQLRRALLPRRTAGRPPPRAPGDPDELRDAFADGWRIEAIGPVTIDSSLPAPAGRIGGWRTRLTRR
jgi:hypothetical protein